MPRSSRLLCERIAAINWLVIDVDGVLTDGGITYDDNAVAQKMFHVRDGSGLKCWHQLGSRTALITGRTSNAVELRAAELGIAAVYQGVSSKLDAYREFLRAFACRPEQVCAIGDDLPDLSILANSGLAVAVADACTEVRALADYVTAAPGGKGAVREVIELMLKAQGHWTSVVARFRDGPL